MGQIDDDGGETGIVSVPDGQKSALESEIKGFFWIRAGKRIIDLAVEIEIVLEIGEKPVV